METQPQTITKLEKVIEKWGQKNCSPFTPTTDFYAKVGMTHIRFGKLRRGTAIITAPEVRSLANFFQIPVTDLI